MLQVGAARRFSTSPRKLFSGVLGTLSTTDCRAVWSIGSSAIAAIVTRACGFRRISMSSAVLGHQWRFSLSVSAGFERSGAESNV